MKACHKICPIVRQQIFDEIDAVSETLHYNNAHPETGFFCLHPTNGGEHSADTKPLNSCFHPATLSEDGQRLICTEDEDMYQELNDGQTAWFGSAAATSELGK